jgi:hypothetical protein
VRWSDKIGQLLVEVHHTEVMEKTVPLLESMDEQGFRIVSNEANGNSLTEVPSSRPLPAMVVTNTRTRTRTMPACGAGQLGDEPPCRPPAQAVKDEDDDR